MGRAFRGARARADAALLTARDAVEDRITGLDQGADDYLTKPFEFRELLARREASGSAFVLVLGASGSGKSSLVKAGLLPDLMLHGIQIHWVRCTGIADDRIGSKGKTPGRSNEPVAR